MQYFFAGTAFLVLGLLFFYWLAGTSPKNVKRSLAIVGVIILVVLTAAFILTGRFGLALPALLGALAMAMRTWHAWRWWSRLGGFFGGAPWAGGTGGRGGTVGAGAAGEASKVETDWLRMELDHSSGRMDGEILRGPHKGKQLSDLETADLAGLHGELAVADADGLRLLESYLERAYGEDWPEKLGLGGAGGGRGEGFRGSMDGAEALRILGLAEGASDGEIKGAHKDLMSKLHPDRGGSDYLAAKINEAKDILLGN
ncbi:MAG: hypothetical protein V3R73_03055 [Sphingomonadales bacterium]